MSYIKTIHLVILFFSFTAFASEQQNTYINEIVGIEISKPKSWFFLSKKDASKSRRNVKLYDKEFQKLLQTKDRLLIVTLSKYKNPEERTDVSPTVNIIFSKLGKSSQSPPELILESAIVSGIKKYFDDFEYVLKPTPADLSGKKAAKTIIKYTVENQNGYIFKVKSEMWLVPKGKRALLIGMSAPAQGSDTSEKEFKAILKSIKLK